MDDKRLERIEDKIDSIADRLSAVDVTLAKQHVSLAEHIKRTNLLEKQMAPVVEHVNGIKSLGKLITIIAAVSAIVSAIIVALR